MKTVSRIDRMLFDAVSAEAVANPRRRKNFNFHQADNDRVHRLLNAIEPGSYVMPHRHQDPDKAETLLVLRGRLGVALFDDSGRMTDSFLLAPGLDCCGVDIPAGIFHTVFALTSGTVMFECKAGPYRPLVANEKAPWAPLEGAADAAMYLDRLVSAIAGSPLT